MQHLPFILLNPLDKSSTDELDVRSSHLIRHAEMDEVGELHEVFIINRL